MKATNDQRLYIDNQYFNVKRGVYIILGYFMGMLIFNSLAEIIKNQKQ